MCQQISELLCVLPAMQTHSERPLQPWRSVIFTDYQFTWAKQTEVRAIAETGDLLKIKQYNQVSPIPFCCHGYPVGLTCI